MKLTEKQKNCKYCHYDSKNPDSPFNDNGAVLDAKESFWVKGTKDDGSVRNIECFLSGKALRITWLKYGDGRGYALDNLPQPIEVRIENVFNFCPQCGRPLNEEEE
ncbi:hypothetical protein H5S09_04100 [Limosilactobacillus sp. STM2_1]|uniref:Uncharacterized protein n=1 Tax=Limosilactobacillus rudii TaxID=2759755 RepID=A0A7W3YN38_9LACO|nr:hypothetical protein [Limosilactobacillus rudii]MBB1078945.1 hypothetical protein [Limosilactobacillus rudii]MBB1097126.1 hypothetical protein [Limosilactobacillus rudii]MCD7134119.1 hypothetical protein [Limosilactobacillus rudii]